MIPTNRKSTILASAVVLVAAAAGIFWYVNRPPVEIAVAAETDLVAKKALGEALVAYNAQSKRYIAILAEKDDPRVVLTLGPYADGGTPWRSMGWRFWSRLETLAGVEGKYQRSIIRHLREGKMDAATFESTLIDIRKAGVTPIVIPRAPAAYGWALERYLVKLGGEGAGLGEKWTADGLIATVDDMKTAVDQVVRGKAAFILANDQAGGWLGRSVDNHPEGFTLPGSMTADASWVLGKLESFVAASKPKSKKGMIDLLTYLTSAGVSQRFAKNLTGQFYSWKDFPAKGKLPVVEGPTELIDPEARAR